MVCFVILHYVALEETVSCVESILNNIDGDKKIILVDNASPNNSGAELEKLYHENPSVDVIKTQENLGFARGNNFGYGYAVREYNPDFIVVMNNDMEIVQKDFLTEIDKSFRQYQYYILGPDTYSTKKKYHQNPQNRQIRSLKGLKRLYWKLYIKYKLRVFVKLKWWLKDTRKNNTNTVKPSSEQEPEESNKGYVDQVVIDPLLHGSCYIFSSLFTEKHPNECFYPKTFMYMEAEILYYLSKKANEKIIYYPGLKVYHHEDVATDAEYKKQYNKSVFTLKCLMNSAKEFIKLMESDEK